MEKRRKNAEILDRSIAFFYDMIYQINMAIQEQDLNRKSFKFENNCSYYFPFPLGQRVVSVF